VVYSAAIALRRRAIFAMTLGFALGHLEVFPRGPQGAAAILHLPYLEG
jgi:hypothetical protein